MQTRYDLRMRKIDAKPASVVGSTTRSAERRDCRRLVLSARRALRSMALMHGADRRVDRADAQATRLFRREDRSEVFVQSWGCSRKGRVAS